MVTDNPEPYTTVSIPLSRRQATFLRHAISVALRSPVFDEEQRGELLAIDAYMRREADERAR